jgi:hypothetical protein
LLKYCDEKIFTTFVRKLTGVTKEQINCVYAEEADLLNVALSGMTAKQWRDQDPDAKGNIRDFATLEQFFAPEIKSQENKTL